MGFILSCIVIAVKGMLGTLFLSIVFVLAGLFGVGISFLFSQLFADSFSSNFHQTKTKYKGQKIIIQGGRKDEE